MSCLRFIALAIGAVVIPAIACRGGWVPDERGHCPTMMLTRWER